MHSLLGQLKAARQHVFTRGESWSAAYQRVLAGFAAATPSGSATRVDDDALTRQIATALGYEALALTQLQTLAPRFDLVAYPECRARRLLVVQASPPSATVSIHGSERDASPRTDSTLFAVLDDPFDNDIETWVRHRLGPQRVRFAFAAPGDLELRLSQLERGYRAMEALDGLADDSADDETVNELSVVGISEDSSAVVRLVNSTIFDALQLGASDIHLETEAEGLNIKLRIDGILSKAGEVSGLALGEEVISRIKVLADLDIAERRIPQDGRFRVTVNGRDIDLRVSIMPSLFGEDAVLRLLDRRALTQSQQALTLDTLGLSDTIKSSIRKLANLPHGMLLVTGPTGSGKTTTLYGVLTEINQGFDKIVTIEDPVEYRLPGVLQIPVNDKKGLSFARGLRSILRHDPDRIMVGEIRDPETAEIAVQAALTGHLVLTTVHANSVFDVLGRFLHMQVDPYSFSAALNGIVAQRLLRILCDHCATDDNAPVAELMQRYRASGSADVSSIRLRRAVGCSHCRGTGYKGRIATAEVMFVNDELRHLITEKAPLATMKRVAAESGVVPLRHAAMRLALEGRTTMEEVERVTLAH
jgi:general secretion pathway protein E